MNEHNDTYLLNPCRLSNFVSAKNEHQVQFRRKNHKKGHLKRCQIRISLSSHSCHTSIYLHFQHKVHTFFHRVSAIWCVKLPFIPLKQWLLHTPCAMLIESLHFEHTANMCVLYDFQNRQWVLPYTASNSWSLWRIRNGYALFIFKLVVPFIVIQCEWKSNRCNSMQIFIYCKATLHVSGVTAPIIRNIKNCTRSLRYRSYYEGNSKSKGNFQITW